MYNSDYKLQPVTNPKAYSNLLNNRQLASWFT